MRGLHKVAALAAVTTVASVGVAVALVPGGRVTPAEGRSDRAVVTPLLSARRIPEWLVRPVAKRRLSAAVAPALAALPTSRCVVVSDGATELVSDNPDAVLTPASNLKLLVGLAALRVLGADSTLGTRVLATAPADGNGTIGGDVFLVGSGDPLLETAPYGPTQRWGDPPHTALESVADAIVAAGVKHITGSVRGDESRYDANRVVASWPSRLVAQNQVGPLSGLSVNDGRGYPAVGAAGGTVRPASDPPTYAAQMLTDLLRARGVVVDGAPASSTAPPGATELAQVPSLTVGQIVSEMLTFSDNNTAELLLKELGAQKAGAGSTEQGLSVERDALAAAAVDLTGTTVVDGSGLDPTNKVSCRLLDKVLTVDGPDGPLASGLARPGQPGTLRDRFRRSPVAGAVSAKTGTLRGVSALSGWLTTERGSRLSFSILLDLGGQDVGAGALSAQERVVEALRSYPDVPTAAALEPVAP